MTRACNRVTLVPSRRANTIPRARNTTLTVDGVVWYGILLFLHIFPSWLWRTLS